MAERGVSGKKQLVCSHLVQFCVRRNEKSSCGVFSSKQAKSIHQIVYTIIVQMNVGGVKKNKV